MGVRDRIKERRTKMERDTVGCSFGGTGMESGTGPGVGQSSKALLLTARTMAFETLAVYTLQYNI